MYTPGVCGGRAGEGAGEGAGEVAGAGVGGGAGGRMDSEDSCDWMMDTLGGTGAFVVAGGGVWAAIGAGV